ncbi:MAG: flavin reductase family protein [Mesorhizobium sp.]
MLIRVTSQGRLFLEKSDDFRSFAIEIDADAGHCAGPALARIARLEGDAYAWVSQDGLRALSTRAGDAEWEAGLAGMVKYAASKGWLDPQGAIRAHIVNADALSAAKADGLAGVDVQSFKQAMRNLAGGVAIVATGCGSEKSGLTVTAVTSVSIDPPCLLICVNKSSASHDAILANGTFAVSILGDQHDELARRFAGVDGVTGLARFELGDWESGATGSPILADAICSLDCELLMHQSVGSHGVFIGRVVATNDVAGAPLVNFQGQFVGLTGH